MADSIRAYDVAARVAAYDRDMEIMHPLRSKMIAVAVEVLPLRRDAALRALDLGIGTGLFTSQFLAAFPRAHVLAIDGAAAMIGLCRQRLGDRASQVEFAIADFRQLAPHLAPAASLDVVFSAFALHHLEAAEKRTLLATALGWLKPGGWFLNADLVVARDPSVEHRIQQLRVEGIVFRAPAGDARFADHAATRAFLDRLEAEEKDQPLTLDEDLRIARDAGLASVEVFWKEYREAVWGGPVATRSA